jgi:hypothetical protein
MRNFIDIMEAITSHPPLPAPGETPWWIIPLAPMTKKLKNEWGSMNWGWTTGGCFAFADRLQNAYGGELWGASTYDEDNESWDIQHAVVKIGNTFYDYNGVFHPEVYQRELMHNRFRNEPEPPFEMISKAEEHLGWPDDDFLDDKQWKTLLRILRTGK